MPAWWWQVVALGLLIALNGYFALAEIAIISSRKSKLAAMARRGEGRARTALALAEAPTHFLSSVQVGITLVGILAGAVSGAAFAQEIGTLLGRLPLLAPYRGPLSLGLTVLVVTYFTVVLGELVPKRLALGDPERIALRVARPMQLLARVATPVVGFLGRSSDLILRLLGRSAPTEPSVTDEEITALFEEGISAGVFERAEKEIVERLFRLSDRRVNSIMTPRAEIVWLPVEATAADIIRVVAETPLNAYPVCQDDLDHLLGVVLARDLVVRAMEGAPIALRDSMRKPLVLHEGVRALKAIEQLKGSEAPLALIINEYGETEGLLTLTDIFRSLVGDIPPLQTEEVVQREDGSLLVDGMLPTDELKTLLGILVLPGEVEGQFLTLAGFIMTYLGQVPHVGETFVWGGWRFEVVDMDGHRIDQVLITHVPG